MCGWEKEDPTPRLGFGLFWEVVCLCVFTLDPWMSQAEDASLLMPCFQREEINKTPRSRRKKTKETMGNPAVFLNLKQSTKKTAVKLKTYQKVSRQRCFSQQNFFNPPKRRCGETPGASSLCRPVGAVPFPGALLCLGFFACVFCLEACFA